MLVNLHASPSPEAKPLPVTRTKVPPAAGPFEGDSEVTTSLATYLLRIFKMLRIFKR